MSNLHSEFSDEIFIALSDYIAFIIKHQNETTCLSYLVLNETKVLYKKEYQIGLFAIKLIEEKTGIQFNEEEAGVFALYLVNFSLKKLYIIQLKSQYLQMKFFK